MTTATETLTASIVINASAIDSAVPGTYQVTYDRQLMRRAMGEHDRTVTRDGTGDHLVTTAIRMYAAPTTRDVTCSVELRCLTSRH